MSHSLDSEATDNHGATTPYGKLSLSPVSIWVAPLHELNGLGQVNDSLCGMIRFNVKTTARDTRVIMNVNVASAPMDISIIVCTRSRPDSLSDCLQRIGELTSRCRETPTATCPEPFRAKDLVVTSRDHYDGILRLRPQDTFLSVSRQKLTTHGLTWEVVVVVNASTDNTLEVLRTLAAEGTLPLRVCIEPIPGLGRARNRGVSHARGEILAFVDDDCYVEPDFLIRLGEVYRDPDVGYCGGRIVLHDPNDYPITVRDDPFPEALPPRSFILPGSIQGANMSVRRAAYDSVAGVDSRLGPGTPFHCDDVDFLGRISAMGWKGGYFPGPTVRHHHRRRVGPALDRLRRSYDFGRGAYYGKFLLAKDTRRLYLRSWRRLARVSLREKNYGTVGRELLGALGYALFAFGWWCGSRLACLQPKETTGV